MKNKILKAPGAKISGKISEVREAWKTQTYNPELIIKGSCLVVCEGGDRPTKPIEEILLTPTPGPCSVICN